MPRKIVLFLLITILLTAVPPAHAQQPTKIPRIGLLQRRVAPTPATPDPLLDAFLKGLQEIGYIDGKNIKIEHRYAEGRTDRLPGIIAEFLQLKVDVIVVASSQAIRVAKQATSTIPIVIVTQGDPVAEKLVNSLARPGGNITGLTRLTVELSGKRLELFKQAVPRISRVGILDGNTDPRSNVQDYEVAARGINIALQLLNLTGPKPDVEETFQAAVKAGVNGLIINRDAVTASYLKQIADLAIKQRLPSLNEDSPYVEAGGLMSYATNDADQFRRAAYYVDRILKGTKPADLSIEQPTKFEFVVNLRTANQIGLTIPPNVLARALGLKNQSLEVRKAEDFGRAFQAAKKERAWAILVTANPLMFSNFGLIADLAIKNRLPAIHSQREFVEAGGLMMYGPSEAGIYRRAAIYVDKILKGAKAAELPVERPAKSQLIFNSERRNKSALRYRRMCWCGRIG